MDIRFNLQLFAIYNSNSNTVVNGSYSDDQITNSGSYVTINAGIGEDTVDSWGSNVMINAGIGDDSVYLYTNASNTTVNGDIGDDEIYSGAQTVSIDGGLGDDYIHLYSQAVDNTITGGMGDDTVRNYSPSFVYVSSNVNGDDVIIGFNSNSMIRIADNTYSTQQSGSDIVITLSIGQIQIKDYTGAVNINGSTPEPDTLISNSTSNTLINGTDYADSISNTGSHVTINGGLGSDSINNSYAGTSIYNAGSYALINTGDGDDVIFNDIYCDYSTINAGAGSDSISNWAAHTTVYAGADHDSIFNNTSNVLIFGNEGNDFLYTSTRNGNANNTLIGGTGDDTISLSGGSNLIRYYNGDGYDQIFNYNSNETIEIATGTYSTQQSGSDIAIKVGNGQMLVRNYSGALNIVGTPDTPDTLISNSNSNTLINGTDYADSISNADGSNVTINAKAGNDTIRSWGTNVIINAGDGIDSINVYVNASDTTVYAGAGNDIINGGGYREKLFGEGGDDYIYLYTNNAFITVDAGIGDDSVYSGADVVSLDGGEGNDYFHIYRESSDVTVKGGLGNDSLRNYAPAFVYEFGSNDGHDSINGFTSDCTIVITDNTTYSTSLNGSDTVLKIGNGDITLANYSDTVNIVGGTPLSSGGLNISNSNDNTVINGSDYDDTISNNGSNVQIYALDGNDSITNTSGEYITLNAGNGINTINNTFAEHILMLGGSNVDSIYGNNNYATIRADSGDDIIIGNHWRSIINGDGGNDLISLTSYWYNTIDGGEGDDYIVAGGGEHSVNGGSGNDLISLSGGSLTVMGGAGDDSIFGDASSAHLYQYRAGDGNDLIFGINEDDTITIVGSTYSTVANNNDMLINVNNGTITLDGARDKAININNIVPTASKTSTLSPQEVIIKFMGALDTVRASGDNAGERALNDAVNVASEEKYSTAQDMIDSMIADCRSYIAADPVNGGNRFLLDKCGINFNNDDTGAITGWDAGGSVIKTPHSIVPEEGSLINYNYTSFDVDNYGLTVKLADSSTTTDTKHAWDCLYTWWIPESLKLIEESYNYNFADADAEVSTLTVIFTNEDGYLGATGWTPDGKSLTLLINSRYYYNFSETDYDGLSPKGQKELDRTVAHELTHAIMISKVYNFYDLPQFITEGTADLTHGTDDSRGYYMRDLAKDPDSFARYLNMSPGTGDNYSYAAGFVFLRYLAKQSSKLANVSGGSYEIVDAEDETLAEGLLVDNTTLTVSNLFEGNAIDLSKFDSTVTKLDATMLTKGINIFGDTSDNKIDGGSGDDEIFGGAGADSLNGGDGDDMLSGSSGDDQLNGGAGADTLYAGLGKDTLIGGNGADVFVHNSGDDLITDYTVYEDKIKLSSGSIVSSTVNGTDVILRTTDGSITVINGTGKSITVVDAGGNETSEVYGDANIEQQDWSSIEGITLNKSKTKMQVEAPFTGTIDANEVSSKLKKIDASEDPNAVSLLGNDNKNTFKAGSGGSTLDGGMGNDKLYGGDGVDVFVFNGLGKDKVYNYSAEDRIVLTDSINGVKVSGKKVVLTVGSGTLTVNKAVGKTMTITDADGQTNSYVFDKKHKTLEDALENANNQLPAEGYWFLDDGTINDTSPLNDLLSTGSLTNTLTDVYTALDHDPLTEVLNPSSSALTYSPRHRPKK